MEKRDFKFCWAKFINENLFFEVLKENHKKYAGNL
jgi:hypothetical protein